MTITVGSTLNRDQPISRYISFTKYLDLLVNRAAFLPSMFSLKNASGTQGDPLEGTWGQLDSFLRGGSAELLDYVVNHSMPRAFSALSDKPQTPLPPRPELSVRTPFGKVPISDEITHGKICEAVCLWVDVWCWHLFDHESIGMWRQYGGGEGAVCLISTVGRLADSLSVPDKCELHIEPVDYISRKNEYSKRDDEFALFLQKSRVYRDEREVRLLACERDVDIWSDRLIPGRTVSVDLAKLVQTVLVHPDSPAWVFNLIEKISSQHGVPCERSAIYEERLR